MALIASLLIRCRNCQPFSHPLADASAIGAAQGVVPQINWNNFGATIDSNRPLNIDVSGVATPSSATVTWSAANTYTSRGYDDFVLPGDDKLMLGYLDSSNVGPNFVSVTINNLPGKHLLGHYLQQQRQFGRR